MGAYESKTFKSGNSIALRLPRALGIGPNEKMIIEQQGTTFNVRHAVDPAEEKRKLLKMLDDLKALPKPSSIQKREPFEFPER
jgi:antitoxin VapB